ncbi:transmembrane protein 186 [Eurosta solidaginis]|uniref:transmembrane protein 186 n=1 Tax=Eurosta solidaginis TaxID=178769 RepID=UPI0035315EB5
MSLRSLLCAPKSINLLHHLPKRIHLRSAYSKCSTTVPTSLLAQSTKIIDAANYAAAATAATTQSNTTNWITIYRLPLIRLVAGFQRLKIYQGSLTALAVPISFALSQADFVSSGAVVVIAAIGGTGLITLALCGIIARNIVGFIYVNEDCDKVKLAYVDYWGKRCHVIAALNDLDIDWGKEGPAAFNVYQNIPLYSDKKQEFKLILNYGIIEEPETFAGIFGE